MNIENIKAIAEIFSAHGLTALEVSDAGMKIRLEKGAAPAQGNASSIEAPSPALAQEGAEDQAPFLNFNQLIEVKSPLVGVFYAAPSPDSENFVRIGSKVKKGDVLCIIEAMKLMNEILAEEEGEIVDICIKNGDIAEFGQILFKMF